MSFHVHKDDIPRVGFDSRGGDLETRMVHGRSMSMVYARRPDGSHSAPHVHPAEQLNFVLEGSVWLIVGAPNVMEGKLWDEYDEEGRPTESGRFADLTEFF